MLLIIEKDRAFLEYCPFCDEIINCILDGKSLITYCTICGNDINDYPENENEN